MKNQNAHWIEPPIIYPNPLLDSYDNANIKMAATMLAMELRTANPGMILDIIAGITQEIETHWNNWNIETKYELDIRRLQSEDNQFKISIDKKRKSDKFYVEPYSNMHNQLRVS